MQAAALEDENVAIAIEKTKTEARDAERSAEMKEYYDERQVDHYALYTHWRTSTHTNAHQHTNVAHGRPLFWTPRKTWRSVRHT